MNLSIGVYSSSHFSALSLSVTMQKSKGYYIPLVSMTVRVRLSHVSKIYTYNTVLNEFLRNFVNFKKYEKFANFYEFNTQPYELLNYNNNWWRKYSLNWFRKYSLFIHAI